jgi:lysyl-tRNA synthetase class 2
MASTEELRQVRLEKLEKIKSAGINPYPARVNRTHTISDIVANFDKLSGKGFLAKPQEVTVVGRVMSLRGQGALAFVDLFDGTGRFQALLKKDNSIDYDVNPDDLFEKGDAEKKVSIENAFGFFREVVDESDFISVTGKLFTTKKGQPTIEVSKWSIVAKSLLPMPDEFYGLKDEDERYRKRYIDILLNPKVADMVRQKSAFWNSFRSFLLDRNFVEVQTPVIENTTGGADAEPFKTHHNALDIDVYLRISAGELWQKKLMVAGLPRTFEIGRIFRNEGMSKEHLQDYTQIEFYQAFSDYHAGMEMVKELYRTVATETFGTTEFEINGEKVDLANEWETYDFVEILRDRFDIDVLEASVDQVVDKLKEAKIDFDKDENGAPKINKEKAVDQLWKSIRKEYTGPGFLINVPVFLEPLAKKTADGKDAGKTVERFQVILGGSELGKGFSELNDPIDQSQRFEHQEKLRAEGDAEAQMKDSEYIEAMEHGMPPTFGFGISERLFAVLSGKPIRETTIFPLMRPRD